MGEHTSMIVLSHGPLCFPDHLQMPIGDNYFMLVTEGTNAAPAPVETVDAAAGAAPASDVEMKNTAAATDAVTTAESASSPKPSVVGKKRASPDEGKKEMENKKAKGATKKGGLVL